MGCWRGRSKEVKSGVGGGESCGVRRQDHELALIYLLRAQCNGEYNKERFLRTHVGHHDMKSRDARDFLLTTQV